MVGRIDTENLVVVKGGRNRAQEVTDSAKDKLWIAKKPLKSLYRD